MNVIELKAKAYDIMAQMEALQRLLQQTNQMITEELKRKKDADKGITVSPDVNAV